MKIAARSTRSGNSKFRISPCRYLIATPQVLLFQSHKKPSQANNREQMILFLVAPFRLHLMLALQRYLRKILHYDCCEGEKYLNSLIFFRYIFEAESNVVVFCLSKSLYGYSSFILLLATMKTRGDDPWFSTQYST